MMNDLPLSVFLVLALLLFGIGLFGALTKRNVLMVLVSIELMMNAAILNLVAFSKYGIHPSFQGQAFALLAIGIAAFEAVVGLAILYAFYRKNAANAEVRPAQPGKWQTFGTAALVTISAVLMVLAVTGGYFQ